ncbi:helix-turn-helix domain-containing protein [Paractinoplanes rhizophilus]|uniref:Helix-turn-helix domain-containing protein n=1 Tax=Paractinoplanes rhizophilus TaxID=1416877 RepID=A0ABW2HID6_9ACTN
MAEGAHPAVARRRLQIELRRARERAGLTQKEVADSLGWPASKLLRIENGTEGVTAADLRHLLNRYGAQDQERVEELTGLASLSLKLPTAAYGKSVPGSAITFWNLRAGAVRVRQFETLLVPGLLQTEDYAREVVAAYSTPDMSRDDVNDRVAARMDQQNLLDRNDRPDLYFIIDEAAVRRWMGGPRVMRDQVGHLKQVCRMPRVTLQIVPFERGSYGGIRGPFQILEFSEGEDYVLYLDDDSGGLVSRDTKAETEPYLTLFWELEEIATAPHETVAFLDDVAAHIE